MGSSWRLDAYWNLFGKCCAQVSQKNQRSWVEKKGFLRNTTWSKTTHSHQISCSCGVTPDASPPTCTKITRLCLPGGLQTQKKRSVIHSWRQRWWYCHICEDCTTIQLIKTRSTTLKHCFICQMDNFASILNKIQNLYNLMAVIGSGKRSNGNLRNTSRSGSRLCIPLHLHFFHKCFLKFGSKLV
jgi:hypothetical protein